MISLKVLGFVSHAQQERRRVRQQGAAFAAGIAHRGLPEVLAAQLHRHRTEERTVRTRRQQDAGYVEPAEPIGRARGARQAFRWWAPRALNAADKSFDGIFAQCADGPPMQGKLPPPGIHRKQVLQKTPHGGLRVFFKPP